MPFSDRHAPSLAVDLGMVLAALAGVILTVVGWFAVGADGWKTSAHLDYFLVLWPVVTGIAFAFRLSALTATVSALLSVAIAAGELAAVAAVATLALSSATLGQALLGRWRTAAGFECLLVGLAVFGTAVALMVHLPINYFGTYALLLALPIVCNRHGARLALDAAWQRLRPADIGTPAQRLIGAAAGAIAIVHLLVAMMPESGHDALATHLLVPAHVHWNHAWDFDVDLNIWAVMPMMGNWLYTIGYMFAEETGARLVNFGGILLLGGLVFELAKWIGADRFGGTVAVLLYLSTPLTLLETSTLFIESVWTCFVVGGAMAVLRAVDRGDGQDHAEPRQLVTGGILLGGAMAAKAVTFMVLPPLALVLVIGWRRWLRRDLLRATATGLVGLLAIGTLCYVRAYVITGNPVFPFYNAVFQSPLYPAENFSPPPMFVRGTSWDVLYRMTFESSSYLESRPGAPGFQWLLLFAPIALGCALRRHRRSLLVLAVGAAAVWLTFRQTAYLRYVFPSFAMFAACVGFGLGRTLTSSSRVRVPLALAAIAAVALNLTYFSNAGYYSRIVLSALTGPSGRAEYLAERRPLRRAVEVVNALNKTGAPVAYFSQSFGTGLHAAGLWSNWYSYRFSTALREARTASELGVLLAREGARYLLLRPTWKDGTPRELIRAVSDEVHKVGDISIRRLKEDYRFREELLVAADFATTDRWSIADGAVVEAGMGATVTASASVKQRVAVHAGREYRFTARVRRADEAVAAQARLQLNWFDADKKAMHTDLEVVACESESKIHSMDVRAPEGAASVVVFATGHSEAAVVFESLSFRN